MESIGIQKLYESFPVPTLYVGRVEDLLGRVPLFACFLDGNTTSTILYKYAGRQKQAFEFGCADGQGPASHRDSSVYEINDWLWNFGRPQPRVRGLSVAKTEESPGLRHPGALGRPGRQANWWYKRYDMYILGIRLVYTCQIFNLNKNCILMNAIKSQILVLICAY